MISLLMESITGYYYLHCLAQLQFFTAASVSGCIEYKY